MKEITKESVYNYLIKDLKEELNNSKTNTDPVWHWSESDYKAFQGPGTKPKRMYYPHGNRIRFASLDESEVKSSDKKSSSLSIDKNIKQSVQTLALAAVGGAALAVPAAQISKNFTFNKGKKDKRGNTDKTEEDRDYYIIEFDNFDEFEVHAMNNGVPNRMVDKLEDYVKNEPELEDQNNSEENQQNDQ